MKIMKKGPSRRATGKSGAEEQEKMGKGEDGKENSVF